MWGKKRFFVLFFSAFPYPKLCLVPKGLEKAGTHLSEQRKGLGYMNAFEQTFSYFFLFQLHLHSSFQRDLMPKNSWLWEVLFCTFGCFLSFPYCQLRFQPPWSYLVSSHLSTCSYLPRLCGCCILFHFVCFCGFVSKTQPPCYHFSQFKRHCKSRCVYVWRWKLANFPMNCEA